MIKINHSMLKDGREKKKLSTYEVTYILRNLYKLKVSKFTVHRTEHNARQSNNIKIYYALCHLYNIDLKSIITFEPEIEFLPPESTKDSVDNKSIFDHFMHKFSSKLAKLNKDNNLGIKSSMSSKKKIIDQAKKTFNLQNRDTEEYPYVNNKRLS
jgi:hypothetical protein